jgi:hypothetical protein
LLWPAGSCRSRIRHLCRRFGLPHETARASRTAMVRKGSPVRVRQRASPQSAATVIYCAEMRAAGHELRTGVEMPQTSSHRSGACLVVRRAIAFATSGVGLDELRRALEPSRLANRIVGAFPGISDMTSCARRRRRMVSSAGRPDLPAHRGAGLLRNGERRRVSRTAWVSEKTLRNWRRPHLDRSR